ncbi:MAG: alpha/beta hydrolase [Anaerolineae bacterium]
MTVPADDPFEVTVDGDFLVEYLFESLYDAELIPMLQGYIANAAAGDLVWVEEHGAQILVEETFATGFFHTVLCAEDADFEPEVGGDVRPLLAGMARETWAEFRAACAVWDVAPIDADEPVTSPIPALLLAGEFDPVTPPAFAEHLAESLPNGAAVTIPGGSHGAVGAGSCPFQIVLDFLEDPQQPPDTGCTQTMAVSFQRPLADYMLVPTERFGAQILIPEAWQEVEDGVFEPPTAGDLRMAVFTLEGDNANRTARAYIRGLEADGWEKFGVETVEGRDWHIFLIAEGDLLTVLSAASAGDGIYVLALTAPEPRLGDLADVIYFPAVEAFEIAQ